MKTSLRINWTLIASLIVCMPANALVAGAVRLTCVMHVHSEFSGKNTTPLEQISREAEAAGIDAVVLTDKDFIRVDYGLWPLRNVFKQFYEDTSVFSGAGPGRYLRRIAAVQKDHPDLILILGLESAPFYYWTGSPFDKTLRMNGWQKHMLITGLNDEKDYAGLPVVSNPDKGSFSPLMLWPLLLLLPALLLWDYRTVSITCFIAGLALLANNYPFRSSEFNQYHGPQDERPYQSLIDYVVQKGGLIYWAHPEAPNNDREERLGPVSVLTPRYARSILDTRDYTGFAIFSEGYREAGSIGGFWDKALAEYCSEKRKNPVWAVGELDYGTNSFGMGEIKNVLLADDRSAPAVLKALREGKYFVSWRSKRWELKLEEFSVGSGGDSAFCGGEVRFGGPVRIRMKFSSGDGDNHRVTAQIIRNGALVKIIDTSTPADVIFEDPYVPPPGKSYYRVFLDGVYPCYVATNPVFVQRL